MGSGRVSASGEVLREDVLPALGRSKLEIARLLGVSRQTLYDILGEKQPVTAAMALRFGNGGGVCYAMQQAYDLCAAEILVADAIAAIPTLDAT